MSSLISSPTQAVAADHERRVRTEFGPVLLLCACYAVIGFKFFHFISRYSVNLFFWDHWDYENGPLFEHHSLWQIFRWQHGPPRLGLGALMSALVDPLFHWSSRAQAFEAGILVLLASLSALWLKRRVWGRFEYFDVAIPLLFLVRNQAGYYIAGANIAHGPMPLLLTVLYCVSWTVRDQRWRYCLVLVTNFLLIYTGFGLFMGVVTPLLLTVELFRRVEHGNPQRTYTLLALIAAVASLASFFIGYRFYTAAPCFSTWHGGPLQYLWFIALMFANFAGLKGMGMLATAAGTLIGMVVVASFIFAIKRLLTERPQDRRQYLVIAALAGFALVFCLNTAIGRICFGIDAGQRPWYIPYLVPAVLGLYLVLLSVPRSTARTVVLSGFLVFAGWCSMRLDTETWLMARNRSHDQHAWRECYLQRESVQECDAITNTKIYPVPEATHLQEKLQLLKQKHLNLYSDQK